jgi:O-antigen/teichoic acid export membrane protein
MLFDANYLRQISLKSYRQIFKSSAILGSASLVNIVIGIIRVKFLAVLLGPTGVGLMGLYQSIMGAATTMVGCGLDTSSVRQIAISYGDQKTLALIRRALLWGNLLLGGLGMVVLWFSREMVADLVFHNTANAFEVGCLGVGVFLSLIASSQMSILQGLRRIGDFARVNVLGSIAGLIFGIILILWLGQDGVHWFVITAPVGSVIFSSWYTSRLPSMQLQHDWGILHRQWQSMLSFGVPLMAAALLTLVTQIAARSLVMKHLGLEASGYFQAAWVITMTYIGFVLSAMATDYLPRLTEVIDDHDRAKRLVNEQTEMALLLAAPILLAMLTLAPWVIELLYSKSFAPAAEILRWQVMGDVFKVIGWPMGFIVLAKGRGDLFIATQFNWNIIYLLCLWLGLESMGLLVVGVGFFVAYIFQIGLVRFVAGRLIDFSSYNGNIVLFIALLFATAVELTISKYWPVPSIWFGGGMVCCFGLYSIWKLNQLLDLNNVFFRFLGGNK